MAHFSILKHCRRQSCLKLFKAVGNLKKLNCRQTRVGSRVRQRRAASECGSGDVFQLISFCKDCWGSSRSSRDTSRKSRAGSRRQPRPDRPKPKPRTGSACSAGSPCCSTAGARCIDCLACIPPGDREECWRLTLRGHQLCHVWPDQQKHRQREERAGPSDKSRPCWGCKRMFGVALVNEAFFIAWKSSQWPSSPAEHGEVQL